MDGGIQIRQNIDKQQRQHTPLARQDFLFIMAHKQTKYIYIIKLAYLVSFLQPAPNVVVVVVLQSFLEIICFGGGWLMNVFVIFQCHACTDTAKACCAILDNYASDVRNVLNSVASPSSWPIIRMQA